MNKISIATLAFCLAASTSGADTSTPVDAAQNIGQRVKDALSKPILHGNAGLLSYTTVFNEI